MPGCESAQQENMWFYCPVTGEYYQTSAKIKFCGDFTQQTTCGNKGLEVQSQQSGLGGGRSSFRTQSVVFSDVAGTGKAHGGNHSG